MPTISVLDANQDPQLLERPNANGRQNAAGSRPVALSTEDLAALTAPRPVTQSGAWTFGLTGALPAGNNNIGAVSVFGPVGVTGTFWQETQPVSLASLPLPPGAATELAQQDANVALEAIQADAAGAVTLLESVVAALAATLSVSADGNFPVTDATTPFAFTPDSGTSTGSVIPALSEDANRRAFQFQNASDTDFTVNFDGTASASAGFLVAPGRMLEFYGAACPKGAVSIFCASAAKRYVLRSA